MLDAIVESAARVCGIDDVPDSATTMGMSFDARRSFGSRPTAETRPLTREIVAGRAVIDRQTVHVHDIRAAEDQGFRILGFGFGQSRTLLAVPLLRRGDFHRHYSHSRDFTSARFYDSQIALLKTFAY